VNPAIRPQARDDIIRQFRWYLVDQDAPAAAFRFLDAVEQSIEQLLRMPDVGAPKALRNPALEGLRSWPVEGFEHIRIYYIAQAETVKGDPRPPQQAGYQPDSGERVGWRGDTPLTYRVTGQRYYT